MKSFLLLPLVLIAAGCVTSPGTASPTQTETEPVLATERKQYQPGQVAMLSLSNPLDERIGYNACTWTLELYHDDGWAPAPFEDERMCTMELRTLHPGEVATPTFALDERLPDGRYRFQAVLHRLDSESRQTYWSEAFRIHR